MLYKLILTKIVFGHLRTHPVKVERYCKTLSGALREGSRMLTFGIAIMVEVENPNTGKIIKRRSRGEAKWTSMEDSHVPTHEESHPPD